MTESAVVGIAIPEQGSAVVHHHGPYERWLKPAFDRIVGVALLVASGPVMLALGAAVVMDMGTPVLFRQRRIGRDGSDFIIYKFRTMRPDRRRSEPPPYQGPERRLTHKHPEDPRLTKIGRFLRKWSLDELPQLINVVRGDMSLVGPRPELCEIVERYEPWQHDRHRVKPGITGLWQISARGNKMMHEATEYDLAYVSHISFRTDMKILAATVPAALGRRPGS